MARPTAATTTAPSQASPVAVAKPTRPPTRGRRRPVSDGPSKGSTRSGTSTATADARTIRPPMELIRPLLRVRQMRAFTARRVTRAELDAITEVARWTGSSRNEQPWRFILIRERELIERVAEIGMPQTRGLPTAPAAIAIVMPDDDGREVSRAFDDGRAAERILIAAYALGMGGGISRVRAHLRPEIGELLGVRERHSVRTIVAIGHPTREAQAPKSAPGTARLPREQVVFEERWPSD